VPEAAHGHVDPAALRVVLERPPEAWARAWGDVAAAADLSAAEVRRIVRRRRRRWALARAKVGGDNGTTRAAARRRALQDELLRRWHPGTFVARFGGALRGA